MKTLILPPDEAIRAAAEKTAELICADPTLAVAVSYGESELAVLSEALGIVSACGAATDAMSIFCVCELCDLPDGDGGLRADLAAALSPYASNIRILAPDGERPEDYDRAVEAAGGIGLALLGLGTNSAVGFNEPATQYDTHTHLQRLTKRTRAQLAARFGGEERVPEKGVTLGFKELCAARRIIVVALGEERRDAAFHMLYGRDDSIYPAAYLQLPPSVEVFLDHASAGRL